MDHPSTSNVFPFKGTSAHSDLLQTIRAAAMQTLPPILSGVLSGADDALFDLVQKSHSTFEQQQFFEAMRELRRQRGGVEQRYREHFIAAFAGLEKHKPLVAHYAQPGETSNELSLLDEDELEEQLASEQVAQAIERRHGAVLSQLDSQMGQISGVPLNGMLNPIGPGHMAAAMRAGLRGCDLAPSARLVLFKLYEQGLLNALTAFYAQTAKRLSGAGVGGIAAKPVTQTAPQPAASPSPRRKDEAIRDDLFSALHGLLQDYRAAQRAVGGDWSSAEHARPNAVPLTSGAAISVLSLLQRDLPASVHIAADDPKQSLATQIKRELIGQAERMGVAMAGAPLAAQDEDAIDLVGMLFEVLLNERKFQDQVRRLFTQLIVPFTKVAMIDRRMFMHKGHPARRMLNAVAEACDGNTGESALERELLERVHGLVGRLTTEFNEDLAVFETLQEEFGSFLEQHRKRVELAERRAAEAQRGRERLEQARAVASLELATLMGAREAPQAIDGFLRRYWTHHLALVMLRDGIESERFAQARASGQTLWNAMLECEAGHPRTTSLSSALEPVLVSSGVTGPTATEVVRAMESVLDAVRTGDRERIDAAVLPATAKSADPHLHESIAMPQVPLTGATVVSLRTAAESNLTAAASASLASQMMDLPSGPQVTERGVASHFASFWDSDDSKAAPASASKEFDADTAAAIKASIEIESATTVGTATAADVPVAPQVPELAIVAGTDTIAADPADVEKIRKLEVGSWVEMIGEDHMPQPAKLSWVSPISNRLLFVNRRGMRVCAASAEELAVMLKQGKLTLRQIDTAFERAMTQVLGKLRESQRA